jgi:hypothetical protein
VRLFDIQSEQSMHQQRYKNVAIIQPSDKVTVRNPQGDVLVTVRLDPKLFSGDKTQVVFDGRPIGVPQSSSSIQLSGIYRGSHSIAVQLVNSKGDVLQTSPTVVIYMQTPRVGMVHQQKNKAREVVHDHFNFASKKISN